jgi:hypothetical protein
MPHFESEQWLPAPIEPVFLFFADPTNLPRVMPAWMDLRIERETIVPPPAELVRAEPIQPPALPNRRVPHPSRFSKGGNGMNHNLL